MNELQFIFIENNLLIILHKTESYVLDFKKINEDWFKDYLSIFRKELQMQLGHISVMLNEIIPAHPIYVCGCKKYARCNSKLRWQGLAQK